MDQNEICYLCGTPLGGCGSRDHVPPAQFFARKLRAGLSNLVTVRAHVECNKSYEEDEEYVLLSLGTAATVGKARKALWDDVRSKAKRPQGRRLLKRILGEFNSRPGLLYLPPRMTSKTIDMSRFTRVMWKIARGLYFHHTRRFVPEATQLHIEVCQTEGQISPEILPLWREFRSYRPGGACWDVFDLPPLYVPHSMLVPQHPLAACGA